MMQEIKVQESLFKISSPRDFVTNIEEIVGFEPNNESMVIITTNVETDDVVDCVVVPTLSLVNLSNILNSLDDDKLGFILCHFTKQKLDNVRPSAKFLFETISDDHLIRDFLFIRNNRWGSYLCEDVFCCPKNGNEIK